ELCGLVHRMLDKEPSLRPCALEVRQLSRTVAIQTPGEAAPRSFRQRRTGHEDAVVVDPVALELGVTELMPTIHRPRWTPQIGHAVPARSPITPRGLTDEVSG